MQENERKECKCLKYSLKKRDGKKCNPKEKRDKGKEKRGKEMRKGKRGRKRIEDKVKAEYLSIY